MEWIVFVGYAFALLFILIECAVYNAILSAVFPGAVVRCSLSPLYPPSVLLLCFFVSVFLSLFLNSWNSVVVVVFCFVFSLFAAKVSFSFLLHVLSFTGTSELVNNWKGCLKHVRQHHGGWYREIEKGVVFKTMSWKIFFVVVNVFTGFRYRLPHDCHY